MQVSMAEENAKKEATTSKVDKKSSSTLVDQKSESSQLKVSSKEVNKEKQVLINTDDRQNKTSNQAKTRIV